MRRIWIIVFLVVAMQPAAARMYQWVDPATGRTQLSGTPPAWYRTGGDNPRVFVFENGQLVDDTGIKVNDTERARLRQEALVKAEEDVETAKKKAEQSALLKSQVEQEDSPPPMVPKPVPVAQPEESTTKSPEPDTESLELDTESMTEAAKLSEDELAELRNLISEWEARNQNRAQEMLAPEDTAPDSEAEARKTLQEFLDQNQ